MDSNTSYNFPEILSSFDLEGSVAEIKPFGSGHINSTFYLKNAIEDRPDYLLQRINHYVFKDVAALSNNIKLVTDHLRKKISLQGNADPQREVLNMLPAKTGLYYHQDEQGNYWRIYHYLKGTKSYDLLETAQQAYEGGKAFGRFQALLADMDSSLLAETIPNFHNIEYRLDNFDKALENDPLSRSKECLPEIDFIKARTQTMCTILNLGRQGKLPLRITHNDTKFNNVLLDQNDKAQCVIDLDTVMPGYTAYDFGDAIRTIINTAEEDEKDLSKIGLNVDLFKAYTRGYLSETINFLSSEEFKALIYGALLLPYMQAVRFLTDHLDGDNYFKIHFPGHNLQRARAQLQLLKNLEENRELLESLIYEIADDLRASKERGPNT
ncbi:phosphotransferase enzyme family protein [Desertivirga xinjiangensis]|uniref:phosphotransferase enzyme family protein n=1 Tax=Desertivirga xinjiangensis TaxID=539206 RepID=UPI00210E612E|nr:aminoglycoside phosphotransferase family protein [Pedobacter xinjiangensis]